MGGQDLTPTVLLVSDFQKATLGCATSIDVLLTQWSHVSFSYDGSCSPLIASKIALSRLGTNYQQAGFPCQMLLEGFWAATHLPLLSPSSLTLEQLWVSMDCCVS